MVYHAHNRETLAFVNQCRMNYNQTAMLIMIYGEDTFRVQEKLHQLKTAFMEKYDPTGMNCSVFPSGESAKFSAGEVLQAVCSYPFLGTKRMIIIHGLFDQVKKSDESLWKEGFARMPDTSILIMVEVLSVAALEKKKFFQQVRDDAQAHTYAFAELKGVELTKWVKQKILSCGGTIEPSALTELIVRVGSDLWTLSHEIEKLTAFASGSCITVSMVETLVQTHVESRVFELMDALSKKQQKRCVQLLRDERAAGSDEHYLLTMLGRQTRMLISAKPFLETHPRATKQDIAHALDVHPFVAQKVLEQTRVFSLEDLVRTHALLFQHDVGLKSGKIDVTMAVDLIVDSLLQSSS